MTRINVVPVQELSDEHLRAEYREITRIPSHVIKCEFKPNLDGQPKDYTLGEGHVKFFYDKLAYIVDRFYKLQDEMIKRGFKADKCLIGFESMIYANDRTNLWNNYTPTPEALLINRKRIQKRWPKNAHYYGLRWEEYDV